MFGTDSGEREAASQGFGIHSGEREGGGAPSQRWLGTLTTQPALERPDLLAPVVVDALRDWPYEVLVAEIDPTLADTAAFCEAYEVPLDVSANCVVVSGKREGEVRYAACMVLATTRADVNNVVRRHLDVRKASFAAMDTAVAETGMEYGGITPIGLPKGWPVLVDARVPRIPYVIIGSGVRHSKLALPGAALAQLPGAVVVDELAKSSYSAPPG
jgi:prolyl-tRNA editing enzyme YbaK/EbsC (Cys-tRNA(Pro) deacylase)